MTTGTGSQGNGSVTAADSTWGTGNHDGTPDTGLDGDNSGMTSSAPTGGQATDGSSGGLFPSTESDSGMTSSAEGGETSEGDATDGTSDDSGASCGNGLIEVGEECDGLELQGLTCGLLGLGEGTLACDPTTCTYDTNLCSSEGICGDGMIDPGEQCDGLDLQGLDCVGLGLPVGTLTCNTLTCTFDTSRCLDIGG